MGAVATAAKRKMPGNGVADAADMKKLARQAGDAAHLMKLLGNEKRLLVLCFLAARGEMTVGELVGVAKLSQSALSQHLALMREEGTMSALCRRFGSVARRATSGVPGSSPEASSAIGPGGPSIVRARWWRRWKTRS